MTSPPSRITIEAGAISILAEAFTEELQKGLHAAAKIREEATPEPTYSTDNFEPPFKYLAELQRKHFTPCESEMIRQRITDVEYWKCEASFFEAIMDKFRGCALKMHDWRNLLNFTPREAEKIRQRITDVKYWKCEARFFEAMMDKFRGCALKMEDWRNLAKGYKSLLTQIGFSANQIQQLRLSISGQPYWQSEAEFFKQESNRREYELKMRWKQQNDRRQKRVSHRSVETRQPQSNSLAQTADRVSSRTRSKTQLGGVAKHVSRNRNTRGR